MGWLPSSKQLMLVLVFRYEQNLLWIAPLLRQGLPHRKQMRPTKQNLRQLVLHPKPNRWPVQSEWCLHRVVCESLLLWNKRYTAACRCYCCICLGVICFKVVANLYSVVRPDCFTVLVHYVGLLVSAWCKNFHLSLVWCIILAVAFLVGR